MANLNIAINVNQHYKITHDTVETAITIRLKSGEEVYAIFEHDINSPYLIDNSELILKFRALADRIESKNAKS